MKYFNLVKKFVDDAFKKVDKVEELGHFDRTVYWLKQLKSDADEAFLIAAYAHDTERAFRTESHEDLKDKSFNDDFYTKQHPQRGAEIIGDFLKQQGAPEDFIKRVASLIVAHETGGNDDENLLKDADTISFFEDQDKIDWFISRIKIRGKENIKGKFNWMFDRLSSERAKELAEPYYKQAVKKLENI